MSSSKKTKTKLNADFTNRVRNFFQLQFPAFFEKLNRIKVFDNFVTRVEETTRQIPDPIHKHKTITVDAIKIYLQNDSFLEAFRAPTNTPQVKWETVMKHCPSIQKTFKFMGKEVKQPRYQQIFGQDYVFSGKTHKAESIPEDYQPLISYCVTVVNYLNGQSECKLLPTIVANYYIGPGTKISSHQDNEKGINSEHILSYTLNNTKTNARVFRIRGVNGHTRPQVLDIPLPSNCFAIMGGNFQTHYYHEVPCLKQDQDQRFNITVRSAESPTCSKGSTSKKRTSSSVASNNESALKKLKTL